MNDRERSARRLPPIGVEGPHGPIRLKWHKLRTELTQAPFKLSNLALGWRLGASLEIDILAAADGRFVVLHDATLGPSTTGRGHVARIAAHELPGLFHRDAAGVPDTDAPVLTLSDLVAQLRELPRAPTANLQLDLKVQRARPLTERSVAEAAAAVAGLERAIIVGSHYLDEARRLAEAMPGARLGYDPMLAGSRDQGLVRQPERMLRHIEKRRAGVSLVYLHFGAVLAAERTGFPLIRRLLDLGIETDVWTVNPGPSTADVTIHRLAEAGVRQITTDAPGNIAVQVRRAIR